LKGEGEEGKGSGKGGEEGKERKGEIKGVSGWEVEGIDIACPDL